METNASAIQVTHNRAEQRFEATVDGHLSVADYNVRGGAMVMTHTYTPQEVRGRGIAEKLVRAALDYARAEDLKVVPACSYVAVFFQRHPEFRSLLAE